MIEALKASGLPALRLPGGNCIGLDRRTGPVAQLKTRLDTAWFQYYTNEIGHDNTCNGQP